MTDFPEDHPLAETAPVAVEKTWFRPDGLEHIGDAHFADDGKAFAIEFECCSRCGGSGKWKRKFECLKCTGDGGKDIQFRLYDEKENASRERAKNRKRDKAAAEEAERQATRLAGHQAFVAENQSLFDRAALAPDNKFIADLIAKSEYWGGMTERQFEAFKVCLDRIDEEKTLYANSKPVGEPGDRIEVEVTCRMRSSFMAKAFKGRRMREVYVTEMNDAEGNCYVAVTEAFKLDIGDQALIRGTVKTHDDQRRGWTRTQLSRVLLLELLARAEAKADPAPEPETASAPEPEIEYDLPTPAFGAAA